MRNITMLFCMTLLSVAASAEEPKEDQWFAVSAVGFHHHGEPDVVAIEQEDIEKYFVKQRPFLSETFRKERLSELLEKSKNQEFKPKRSVPLKDPRCFAEVSRINKNEVYIKILKPLGAWRWHHDFQCLAIYKTQRNETIDDIFALDKLYTKLSYTFQGITHGMAGPDFGVKDTAIFKAFGKPDYVYPGQSLSLGQFYYEKQDLHIVTHEYVVYYVEKGKPDWVESMKKQRESNN
jgi:hypothetical protein